MSWVKTLPLDKIETAANSHGVDYKLLAAIVQTESGGRVFCARYEPGYKWLHFPRETASQLMITAATETIFQQTSWGLGQIMGAVVREYGFKGHLPQMCEPDLNLFYCAKHLKTLNERHGDTEADLISSYNQGSPRKTPGGMYNNQRYVDKVYSFLNELRRV